MILSLERFLPTVQGEIDRHYYYCYGEGSIRVEEEKGVVVYIVHGERFDQFVKNSFKQKASSINHDLRFQNVDIFSSVWTSKFGYPFPSSNLGGNDDFEIAGSFNCLAPSRAVEGLGRIHAIHSNYLEIDAENGERHSLYLSACSRLDAIREVPEVGQTIAYSAVRSGREGSYNLYKAACWNE